MTPHSNTLLLAAAASISAVFIVLATAEQPVAACFSSIISFGDSLADTGNLLYLSKSSGIPPHFAFPPYGDTFFHHPTGRVSNGRLVIDFIAERFGLPLVQPYLSENERKQHFGREGVNYAVAGATALDYTFLVERGIYNPSTNVSLATQLIWFKEMLQNACKNNSKHCNALLQNSLFLVGEIGGNDICYAFFQGKSMEEVQSLVLPIVNTIGSAINELIELGAMTLVVPGNLPIGCITVFLSYFNGSDQKDYDPTTGCITWLNNFSAHYNQLLQTEIIRIQDLHPHATIVYADYYNAAMQIFNSPAEYGFSRALTACCGAGGPYNYDSSVQCGYPPSTSCEDPSSYVNFDGIHMTEAAYRLVAEGLLEGPYTIPHINGMCSSINLNDELYVS